MTQEEQLMWGSHQPALMAAVCSTIGPVLEIGVGDFSTPLLHAACEEMLRQLISVEDNPEWAEKFRGPFSGRMHSVLCGPYDQYVPKVLGSNDLWGVVFIDNSPGGEARAKWFRQSIHKSIFVVVHDYHLENSEAIQPYIDKEKISYHVMRRYQPPTLIASLRKAIPCGLLQL